MKRSAEKEMMDLPGNPKDLLVEDLRNLRNINRYLGGYRGVMKGLKRLVAEHKMSRFSLLDVGTGSADIPRVIVQWARDRGIKARIIALEPEAVTAQEALHQTQQWPEITVIRGDGMAPPFKSASFDFVLSSQMLHHFSEEKIILLLKLWSRLARQAILVSDLVRDPLAYCGIRVITQLFTRNEMTRFDGPLSVKRALTLTEWRELFREAAVGPFRVSPIFPYRQMTVISLSR
ncbi:MAG: methyltransferase domain-containing protein [Candidatus Binatia bacterium]